MKRFTLALALVLSLSSFSQAFWHHRGVSVGFQAPVASVGLGYYGYQAPSVGFGYGLPAAPAPCPVPQVPVGPASVLGYNYGYTAPASFGYYGAAPGYYGVPYGYSGFRGSVHVPGRFGHVHVGW